MTAQEERGLLVDRDPRARQEHEERGGTERLWESREVRWSALSGLLLLAGFILSVLDGPVGVATGLYVASAIVCQAAVARVRHHGVEHRFCSLPCVAAFATDPDRYLTGATS